MTAEPTKRCPFCAEEILQAAIKCKHCGEFLAEETPSSAEPGSTSGPELTPEWTWTPVLRLWKCSIHGRSNCPECRGCPSEPPDNADQLEAEKRADLEREGARLAALPSPPFVSCSVPNCDEPRVEGSSLCARHKKVRPNAKPASGGTAQSQMICPHCQTRGRVSTKKMKKKVGISGGKATGAVLTGGLSILATGLSRKESVTEAHCSSCGATWSF
jgi:hypothetical protein